MRVSAPAAAGGWSAAPLWFLGPRVESFLRPLPGNATVRARRCGPARDRRGRHGVCYPGGAHPRPDHARRPRARELPVSEMSDAYDLFREGQKRLRGGMAAQATVPLEQAKRLEPAKASIREALGIAYFRLARWQDAEARVPHDRRGPRADRRLRALRARPRARASGTHRRGERALQARELDGPRVGAVRLAHPRSRCRRQGLRRR